MSIAKDKDIRNEDFWMIHKSKEQIAICKFCCCECIDTDEKACCHTTEIGDCDCHNFEKIMRDFARKAHYEILHDSAKMVQLIELFRSPLELYFRRN